MAGKRNITIHPFLLGISPILYFFSVNKDELSLVDARLLLTLAVTLVAVGLFWLVVSLILKDKKKGAVLASLFVMFFFSYGHIRELIPTFKITLWGLSIGPDKALFLGWGMVLLVSFLILWRLSRRLRAVTGFLNVVSVSLAVLLLVDVVPHAFSPLKAVEDTSGSQNSVAPVLTAEDTSRLPDIYYFIFDRYARADILEKHYGYDNSDFIEYLEESGFYVASRSYANYPRTHISLASSLNMKHLTYLKDEVGEDCTSKYPAYQLLQNHEVWRFLKSRGYRYYHFGDWWSGTAKNRYADENVNYLGLLGDEFFDKFLQTTAAYPALKKVFPPDDIARKRFFLKFERLTQLPNEDGPKFVFVHMLIPHEPFVFDADGSPLSPQQVAQRSLKENYLGQLAFANEKIMELFDIFLSNPENPPIIVLQSDEGPFPPEWGEQEDLTWESLDNDLLTVKTAILNAYYLPGVSKKVLYPSITPVNTFRTIFNHYFEMDYDLLLDVVYTPESGKPYKFIDVTSKLGYD